LRKFFGGISVAQVLKRGKEGDKGKVKERDEMKKNSKPNNKKN
jgi:hypothetical protein